MDLVGDLEAGQVLICGVLPLTDSTTYRAPRYVECRGAHFVGAEREHAAQTGVIMVPINRLKRWPFPSVPATGIRPTKPNSGQSDRPKPEKDGKADGENKGG